MKHTWQKALLNHEKGRKKQAIENAESDILRYGGDYQGAKLIDILRDIYSEDEDIFRRYSDWVRVGVDIEMLIDNLLPQLRLSPTGFDE